MAVKKKKVAAKRKPSKVLTPAQVAKKKDAIVAEKAAVKELKALLKNLVSGPQIKALMQRRDLILEKIAEDRKLYGDNMVFQE